MADDNENAYGSSGGGYDPAASFDPSNPLGSVANSGLSMVPTNLLTRESSAGNSNRVQTGSNTSVGTNFSQVIASLGSSLQNAVNRIGGYNGGSSYQTGGSSSSSTSSYDPVTQMTAYQQAQLAQDQQRLALQEAAANGSPYDWARLGLTSSDQDFQHWLQTQNLGLAGSNQALTARGQDLTAASNYNDLMLRAALGIGGLNQSQQQIDYNQWLGTQNLGIDVAKLNLSGYQISTNADIARQQLELSQQLGMGDQAQGWAKLQLASEANDLQKYVTQAQVAQTAARLGLDTISSQQDYEVKLQQLEVQKQVAAAQAASASASAAAEGMKAQAALRAVEVQLELGNGNLQQGYAQLAQAKELGLANLDLQRQQLGEKSYIDTQDLALRSNLGYAGLSQQKYATDTEQAGANYRAQLAAQVQREQNQSTAADAAANRQLQAMQIFERLRGPSNAFKYQEMLSGLGPGGLPASVGAIAGQNEIPSYQAPTGTPEPVTWQNFQDSTGIHPNLNPITTPQGPLPTPPQPSGSAPWLSPPTQSNLPPTPWGSGTPPWMTPGAAPAPAAPPPSGTVPVSPTPTPGTGIPGSPALPSTPPPSAPGIPGSPGAPAAPAAPPPSGAPPQWPQMPPVQWPTPPSAQPSSTIAPYYNQAMSYQPAPYTPTAPPQFNFQFTPPPTPSGQQFQMPQFIPYTYQAPSVSPGQAGGYTPFQPTPYVPSPNPYQNGAPPTTGGGTPGTTTPQVPAQTTVGQTPAPPASNQFATPAFTPGWTTNPDTGEKYWANYPGHWENGQYVPETAHAGAQAGYFDPTTGAWSATGPSPADVAANNRAQGLQVNASGNYYQNQMAAGAQSSALFNAENAYLNAIGAAEMADAQQGRGIGIQGNGPSGTSWVYGTGNTAAGRTPQPSGSSAPQGPATGNTSSQYYYNQITGGPAPTGNATTPQPPAAPPSQGATAPGPTTGGSAMGEPNVSSDYPGQGYSGPYGQTYPGNEPYSSAGGSNPTNPYAPPPVQGSYASGTDYVPQTGLYQLHQGEAVVPAAQNPNNWGVAYENKPTPDQMPGYQPTQAPSATNYDTVGEPGAQNSLGQNPPHAEPVGPDYSSLQGTSTAEDTNPYASIAEMQDFVNGYVTDPQAQAGFMQELQNMPGAWVTNQDFVQRLNDWVGGQQGAQNPFTPDVTADPTFTTPGMQPEQPGVPNIPEAPASTAPTLSMTGSTPTSGAAPTNSYQQLLDSYRQMLPAPNQIVGRAWQRLSPSQQQFLGGAYQALGYEAMDIPYYVQQSLPGKAAYGQRYAGVGR